jgi:hypothetical protein
MRLTLGAAAGCIPVAVMACASAGDLLIPDHALAAGGAYVLRSAGGEPVPAVWISNESVTVTVLADTIRIGTDGRGDRVLVEEYRESGSGGPVRLRQSGGFTVVRRDARIEITLPCPDLGLCVAPPHLVGQITPGGLVFDEALNYITPLRYDRVGRALPAIRRSGVAP